MSATPKSVKWIQFLVLLGLGLALTWLAFSGQDLGSIWERIATAQWGWVVLSLVLTLLGHLSRARRWQLLISGAGYHAGLLACFVALMTGYLSNLGIPRIGELGRCASLTRLSKTPLLALGGTVVAERVVDVLTLGLLTTITFVAAGERVLGFWANEIAVPLQSIWGWKLAAALAVGLILLGVLAWLVLGRRDHDQQTVWSRIRVWAGELWAGMWSATKMPRKGAFLLHTLIIWVCYYSAPLCTLLALGVGGDDAFSLAFYAFVFGSLARTLPLPAGSMGAYHYLISQLFLALGYTYLEGISVATLNHAVQTAFYLLVGVLGMIAFFVLLRRNADTASPPVQ
jgi:uncharacterized protein (TIRG00374 family)